MFEYSINVEMIRQDKMKGESDKGEFGETKICIRTFNIEKKEHLKLH